MIPGPDFELAEKQARLANAEKLRANLNAPDVQQKVRNWAERYSLEPEFVRYKVLTDDTFALTFAKDPIRQTLHQQVAAEHIKSRIPLVENFTSLPSRGPSAEYVLSGMVIGGAEVAPATNSHPKSIDFKWDFTFNGRTLRIFASHKHTRQEGGSQDNQYSDIRLFMEQARPCHNQNHLFLAICDGEYYQRRPGAGGLTRIATLNRELAGDRCCACTTAELPMVYGAFLERWFTHIKLSPDGLTVEALMSLKDVPPPVDDKASPDISQTIEQPIT